MSPPTGCVDAASEEAAAAATADRAEKTKQNAREANDIADADAERRKVRAALAGRFVLPADEVRFTFDFSCACRRIRRFLRLSHALLDGKIPRK